MFPFVVDLKIYLVTISHGVMGFPIGLKMVRIFSYGL